MKWLLPLALVACACGRGASRVGAGACAAALDWHGNLYQGEGDDAGLKVGAPLRDDARFPACNDTNESHDKDSRGPVRGVQGVDPWFAVMAGGDVYVNANTFPVLATHPLHRYYGQEHVLPAKGPRCRVAGKYENRRVGGYGLRLTAHTDMRIQRHGSGYLREGTRIVVTGRCHAHFVTARRVDPA
jgi:hypothetical protein